MKTAYTQAFCFIVATFAMIMIYWNPPFQNDVSIFFLVLMAGFGMVWGILGFFIVKEEPQVIGDTL